MESLFRSLTVFFEDPIWVGVFERIEDGKLSVAKVTFGAEQKNAEAYGLLRETAQLRFSPAVRSGATEARGSRQRNSRNAR